MAMQLGSKHRRYVLATVSAVMVAAALVWPADAPAQSPAQPGSGNSSSGSTNMTWTVKSMYKFKVQIAFYSRERKHEWPGNGQAWDLNDYNDHTYTLNCRRGEKICFGAWVTGNANKFWGVGFGGRQGCSTCCFSCGQQPRPQVLQP